MAKIRCIGCLHIHNLNELGAFEGFAVCPDCSSVFDISPAVETKVHRNAGLWHHGNFTEHAGVKLILQRSGPDAQRPKGTYRRSARVDSVDEVLLLTCTSRRLLLFRVFGLMLSLLMGAGCVVVFRDLSDAEQWMYITLVVLTGGPALLSFYFALVGIVNRIRIRVDGYYLRVDEGPLPCPHSKSEVPVANIARVTTDYTRMGGRNGVRVWFGLRVWLRNGGQTTLVDDLRGVSEPIYLQQRIAAFLGLDGQGPVGLFNRKAAKDE